MSNPISRRQFLTATVATAASAETAQTCWHRRFWNNQQPYLEPGIRIRQNVLSLTKSQLESLRRGVATLKQLPESDRRSWTFQAAIHGTVDPTAKDPLFNQCEHGTIQFFTWHRAYLHFFERILRWAANDPYLNLPYWNWTSHPILPEPFRLPANTIMNPLYEPKRKANDGSELPKNVVVIDLETALSQSAFHISANAGFTSELENSPHGLIHDLVGGQNGLMSTVPTAARDPIFWLHHCNIDRLWNVWLNRGGGRANPSDSAFLNQAYTFVDETGGTITVRVRDMISSAQLGYRYDSVPNPAVVFIAQEQKILGTAPPVVATSLAPDSRAVPLDKVEAKPLGFKEERVKLNTVKENRETLTKPLAERNSTTPKISISVEGLTADAPPGFVYAIYINLPEGVRSEEVLSRHYVGSINFFGKTRADAKPGRHDHGGEFAATFDVTKVIAGLQQGGKFDPDSLSVTIIPISPPPPGATPAEVRSRGEEAAQKAKITYKRISVLETPKGK